MRQDDTPLSEVKAFFIAVVAALVVLGLTFGVSALMRRTLAASGPPPQPESTPGPSSSPSAAASPLAVDPAGKGLFADNCASCHGNNGEGGYGPNLHKRIRTVAEIAAVVTKGVPNKMPAAAGKLKANEIQAVSQYAAAMGGK